MFEQIYKKLTSELVKKKKQMSEIVETVNNANKDRENATNELAELIKQAEQEKEEFDNQIASINAKILEEKARKEALKAKEQDQINMERVSSFLRFHLINLTVIDLQRSEGRGRRTREEAV